MSIFKGEGVVNLALFLLLGTFWGGSFIAIKYAVGEVSPLYSASGRLLVAVVCLAIIGLLFRRKLTIHRRLVPQSLLVGLVLIGLPFSCLFWGEQFVSPGLAGVLNGTVPIWALIIGSFLLRNDSIFSWQKFIGVVAGFIGLIIIFAPQMVLKNSGQEIYGLLALLGMAISYGLGAVLNRQLMVKVGSEGFHGVVFVQHVFALIFLLAMALVFEPYPAFASLDRTWALSVVYLGFFSTAVAMLIYNHLLKAWGVMRSTAVTYLVPVVATILDFLVFKHAPAMNQVWGMALIFLGLVLIQFDFGYFKKPTLVSEQVK